LENIMIACVARIPRLVAVLGIVAVALGCGSRVPSPETFSPPRPLSDTRPPLVGATVDSPIAVEVSVDVDQTGHADLTTLQLSGAAAAANRATIVEWLRSSGFEPARHNGVPVRAPFKMVIESKLSVQRE
jgi:hypothetical protein